MCVMFLLLFLSVCVVFGVLSVFKFIFKFDCVWCVVFVFVNLLFLSVFVVGLFIDFEWWELCLLMMWCVVIDGIEDVEVWLVIIECVSVVILWRDVWGKFVGWVETLEKLRAYALRDDASNVFVFEGEWGSGVSLVLSEFVKDLCECMVRMIEEEEVMGERVMGKKSLALYVCCRGSTSGECDLRYVLWMMCECVWKMFG